MRGVREGVAVMRERAVAPSVIAAAYHGTDPAVSDYDM